MRLSVVTGLLAVSATLACEPVVVGPGDASSPHTDGVIWIVDTRAADAAEAVMYAALSRGLNFKLTMGNIVTLTPPLTITREDMEKIAGWIASALEKRADAGAVAKIAGEVKTFCRKFPLDTHRPV